MLGYARVGMGRIEIGLRDVPLAGVLLEAEVIISPLAERKGIACRGLRLEAEGGPSVHADPEKLLQVLVNLLADAVKFTPAGGRIDVALHDAAPRVEIHVSDNGGGIAPGDRERIFEPFVRLDDGLARKAEGTGLGLAISREPAVGMGGGLSVESELGRGSTFTVTLSSGRS